MRDAVNNTSAGNEMMNNHQKWQARKNEIITTCGTKTQQELIDWFYEDNDDTCVRLAIYGYLNDNFSTPFNPAQ